MYYKLNLDKNGYITDFAYTGTDEDTVELDLTEINLEYLNCYKVINNKLIFDKEKYQETLAKEEFYNTQISETEVINEYRIIKESNYNAIIMNCVLL